MDEKPPILRANLRGGARVAYRVLGAQDFARPVFYLHGFPGSLLEAWPAHAPAKAAGLTVIALDRPGFGETPRDGVTKFTRFPELLAGLADHLGLDRFGLLAVSGGAPYALAACAAYPERVRAAALVSGMGPVQDPALTRGMAAFNRAVLLGAARAPRLVRGLVRLTGALWRSYPRSMILWLSAILAADDRAILARGEVRRLLAKNLRRALLPGLGGAVTETMMLASPWEFDLARCVCPVLMWHGEADYYVPPELGRYVAGRLPDCTARFVPDKGHFMVIDMAPEVLARLRDFF